MHSPDLTQQNLEKIRAAFPNCVTEARDAQGNLKLAIDFDLLKQELSDCIVEGPQERYRLDWPGKREAMLTANAPIAKTLRPARDESVNFDFTENLFIEGDNLDALKLLQESYLGEVKMIYIDPPYNTGNDFIYEDNFSESTEDFLKSSNQSDAAGNRLISNKETNGKFHSDWLSMMYSRLLIAKNFLKKEGVIFISIDDGEQAQLRLLADRVFGANNFIANIIWQRAFSPKNDAKFFSDSHDFILVYAKEISFFSLGKLSRTEEADARYKNLDDDPRGPWMSGDLTVKTVSNSGLYELEAPSGRIITPTDGRCWVVSKEKFLALDRDNRIWWGKTGDSIPRLKRFLSEVQDGMTPTTLWLHADVGHNQEGRQELKKLFDEKGYFDGPKPTRLLRRLLEVANTSSGDIVLDFFAGSSTTAHAVMQLNAEDGGNRKFIMVQLPEEVDEKHEAYKAGYKTIAEISKERIRRAGQQILEGECHEDWNKDVGFRVLKVDTSNMKDVYYNPNEISQADLLDSVDHIKPDRSSEDLLFQVLLDWGVDLTLPIRRETIYGKEVFIVDQNALVACFEKEINEELVAELAQLQPLRMVFRDNGFASDSIKINATQIFKQRSPMTDVKSI